MNIIDYKKRSGLANFRCSGHKLKIEEDRQEKIPRGERACPLCLNGSVEDEFHFLVLCPSYDELRNKFVTSLVVNPSFYNFLAHINQKKYVYNISDFILQAMRLRASLLKN